LTCLTVVNMGKCDSMFMGVRIAVPCSWCVTLRYSPLITFSESVSVMRMAYG